uniref:Uncharacterized protein n=1 Tax=Anguilla anguilla TaxID=7936 RepID=A0A0E9VG76_ANGAN
MCIYIPLLYGEDTHSCSYLMRLTGSVRSF